LITTAATCGTCEWTIADLGRAGLPRPCVIRQAGIATFEWRKQISADQQARRLGAPETGGHGASPALVRHLIALVPAPILDRCRGPVHGRE